MKTAEWTVQPLGDRALLLVRTPGDLDVQKVTAAARRIRELAPPWLQELVPAYRSIAVHIRSLRLSVSQASEELLRWLNGEEASMLSAIAPKTVELPVQYGGEHGPDIEASAARSGLSVRQFIERHSEAVYDVAMIGFAPGFPYLRGLPEQLAQPRHRTPRLRVPPGSVGIAGGQTGVYPVESPGGWQIVGRTTARLFRPEDEEPFLLAPGDRVKFVPVAESENESEIDKVAIDKPPAAMPMTNRLAADLLVVKPGLQTTIQDLGRPGWQAYGVSVGGGMDAIAMRTANILVGNPEDAAGLEITLLGPTFAVEQNLLVALCGATIEGFADGEPIEMNKPLLLRKGATLALERVAKGCRTYLAIAGGIDVPVAMGSRSTDLRARIGGGSGAALVAGEDLRVGQPTLMSLALIDSLLAQARSLGRCWSAVPWAASAIGPPSVPVTRSAVRLRVTIGAEWEQFDEKARRSLLESAYRVEASSDRMGIRLNGAALSRLSEEELQSHGVVQGTVQVPPDGQPIVLASGCQPTGGYPKLAHVITADLPVLAQLAPGDSVRFERVEPAQAMQETLRQEQEMALLKAGLFARMSAIAKGGSLA